MLGSEWTKRLMMIMREVYRFEMCIAYVFDLVLLCHLCWEGLGCFAFFFFEDIKPIKVYGIYNSHNFLVSSYWLLH